MNGVCACVVIFFGMVVMSRWMMFTDLTSPI